MLKVAVIFAIIWALLHCSVYALKGLKAEQKWSFVKQASVSLVFAIIAVAILSFIVLVF